MKSQTNQKLQVIFFAGAIMLLLVLSSCTKENKDKHQSMDMSSSEIDSTIIRSGEIDLQMIDINKDGMVYQDPMDWNVVSDEPGKCPLCKMQLKEVSIETARKNLIEHDFKVKNN